MKRLKNFISEKSLNLTGIKSLTTLPSFPPAQESSKLLTSQISTSVPLSSRLKGELHKLCLIPALPSKPLSIKSSQKSLNLLEPFPFSKASYLFPRRDESHNLVPALFFLLITLLLSAPIFAQPLSPKREFRGIWIATVENIDWPSGKQLSTKKQTEEFIGILNRLKKDKFNAIFIQIRPSADAFYESSIEPWSEWLTGRQGRRPSPYYDPLKFIIEQCRNRGIEVHAWINPFRSVMNIRESDISPRHVSRIHPEWNIIYGKYKWLNPGLPQVRDYVLRVVMDVVKRYNIDGIHFDDYFYPYQDKKRKFRDERTFALYSRGINNIDDWRRDNINLFIKSVSDSIKKVNPAVVFGISPFGIWKNKWSDASGSPTSGSESYNSTYADSRKWLKEGWIDYLVPQLYWNIGNRISDYKSLAQWWNDNSFGKNIYLGESVYKINSDKNLAWYNPNEIPSQIKLNRSLGSIKGNVFFNTNTLLKNPLGLEDSLKNNYYKYYALLPQLITNTAPPPPAPANAGYQKIKGKNFIYWERPLISAGSYAAKYYVVYSFTDNEKIDISRSDKIAEILYGSEINWYDDRSITAHNSVTYVVTSIDKYGNESSDSCRIFVPAVYIAVNRSADTLNISNPNTLSVVKSLTGFKVSVTTSASGFIALKLFDLSGRQIKTIFYGYKKEGSYEFELPENDVNLKTFIIQLRTSGYYSSQKITTR
jgi:uncharacterized lipoprotein YddW (UPF0748 family)